MGNKDNKIDTPEFRSHVSANRCYVNNDRQGYVMDAIGYDSIMNNCLKQIELNMMQNMQHMTNANMQMSLQMQNITNHVMMKSQNFLIQNNKQLVV